MSCHNWWQRNGKGASKLIAATKGDDLYSMLILLRRHTPRATLCTWSGEYRCEWLVNKFPDGRLSHSGSRRVCGMETSFDLLAYDDKAELVAFHEQIHTLIERSALTQQSEKSVTFSTWKSVGMPLARNRLGHWNRRTQNGGLRCVMGTRKGY